MFLQKACQSNVFFCRASPASSINPNPFFVRRGFEPLLKFLANRSCVPLVASGKAERNLNPKPLCPLQGRGLKK